MNAIHYKVREDNHIVVKGGYVFIGVNMDGMKEVLSICMSTNEGSKFWLSPHKDKKEFAKDLKTIYGSVNETEGMKNLIELREKWGSKYPNVVKSWKDNWDNLSTFFQFSPSIRKIVYTTNVIESLDSQFRKFTKTKLIFPNDDSLMKMLYLSREKVNKKWTRNYPNWDLVINELKILLNEYLSKECKKKES